MENQSKYLVAIVAAVSFMGAAFYLPAQTFLAFFAVVLFIIPVAFFVQMIQTMARD